MGSGPLTLMRNWDRILADGSLPNFDNGDVSRANRGRGNVSFHKTCFATEFDFTQGLTRRRRQPKRSTGVASSSPERRLANSEPGSRLFERNSDPGTIRRGAEEFEAWRT